ncbi:MAG: DUF389 domain-containing protein [Patescibacteria group bacterium]
MPNTLSQPAKENAIAELIRQSSPRYDFFLMVTLAIAIASFGVILDDTPVLIGSMLIAPVLYPVLTLALGLVIRGPTLIARSLLTLFIAVGCALGVGVLLGLLFHPAIAPNNNILETMASELYAPGIIFVAFLAGLAAAFGNLKKSLGSMLPGVSIALSLVPPLATAGVGASQFSWDILSNGLLIFFINVICIVVAAAIVFSLFGLGRKRTFTRATVRADEKQRTT